MLDNKTDGPGLLTEASCMVTREENSTVFLLTLRLISIYKKLTVPSNRPQHSAQTWLFMLATGHKH